MQKHILSRRTLLKSSAVVAVALSSGSVGTIASGALAAEDKPSLKILSPTADDQITGDMIDVEVEVSNFTLDGSQSGRPDEDGVGHIHVMLDTGTMATLTGFYGSNTFSISGEGLAPGMHMLIIDLASNTHMDMMDTAQMVSFDYQPDNPKPLPDANYQGEPGVTLVSPTDGETVPAKFTIEVEPVNFTPSDNLEGKTNVPGYGHYHVFVDTPMMGMGMDSMSSPEAGMMGTPMADDGMAMMSMAGMVLMPGSDTFDLDLSAWGSGEHTIWIEPVQNDHTMFETFGHVEFKVNVEG